MNLGPAQQVLLGARCRGTARRPPELVVDQVEDTLPMPHPESHNASAAESKYASALSVRHSVGQRCPPANLAGCESCSLLSTDAVFAHLQICQGYHHCQRILRALTTPSRPIATLKSHRIHREARKKALGAERQAQRKMAVLKAATDMVIAPRVGFFTWNGMSQKSWNSSGAWFLEDADISNH